MKNEVIQGDCLEKLKELEANSVDSIVTDPPYHLVSIVKRSGGENARNTPAMNTKEGGVFARKAKGFMGKEWDGLGEDGIGIANNPVMWAECLRVLKPGGYLLSFGGTRTYHRMACAIEDAGFEVRDMIEWVYGSGFPKSLNIGKVVDKLQGNEREVVGSYIVPDIKGDAYGTMNEKQGGSYKNIEVNLTKGTSEWEGWGTALKPAHEPICMARKPLAEKTVAENVLKYGTGGINIDESRVDFVSEEDRKESTTKNQHADFGTKPMTNNNVYGDFSMIEPKNFNPTGRFPANLIHDNSEEVRECFPDSKSTGGTGEKSKGKMGTLNWEGQATGGFGDSGNASRFFKSIIYQAKASKSDRGEGNNHATVKPTALMEYLINMISREGQTILDPFAGSGTTGVACKNLNRNYILIEKEQEYIDTINKRLN